ncbi:MAG: hypothetical protein FJ137_17655 [Deltaproteobacteria bacterium]|nr:hypothetical protein [Deltaproteobacteria bacterium]
MDRRSPAASSTAGLPHAARLLLVGGLLAAVAAVAGCARTVGPPVTGCANDLDCLDGEACSAGACVTAGSQPCASDLECDPGKNEVCSAGLCIVAANAASNGGGNGAACTATKDCGLGQYCESGGGQCAPLPTDWCRQDSQCSGLTVLCSNRAQGSDFPGRCVQCIDDGDCDAGFCVPPGVCQAAPTTNDCGPNSQPVAGGRCRCDPGFVDDDSGACVPASAGEGEGEGEGEGDTGGGDGDDSCEFALDQFCDEPDLCPPGTDATDCANSSGDICLDFGWYGDGTCDSFCPQPDPDCAGGGGGSDTCVWANDNECDEPVLCEPGTDTTDCSGGGGGSGDTCVWANDNECDEPNLCASGTDTTDCSGGGSGDTCIWANDNFCDEPDLCAPGTDTTDCA